MSVAKDIRLSVIAETSKYRQEIAKTGTYTAKQLNAASLSFAREATKAQAKAASAAKAGAKEAESAWKDVGATLKTALGFSALKGAVTGIYSYIDGIHAARAETIALSEATGISVGTLGTLQAAVERAGGDFKFVEGGLEDFGERMFDFSRGAGEAKEAFELLNVKVKDGKGQLRDTDSVLREVITKMQGVENAATKNAIAQQLFSDAGNRLNAVLGDSSLAEWNKYAEETGKILDDEAIRATKEWTQATSELQGVLKKTAVELLSTFDVSGLIKDFTLGLVFAKEVTALSFEDMTKRANIFFGALKKQASGDIFGAWSDAALLFQDGSADILQAAIANTREFDRLRDTVGQAGEEVAKTGTKLGRMSDDADKAHDALYALADAHRKAAQAAMAQVDAAQGQADRMIGAERELAAMNREFHYARMDQEDQAIAAYGERIEALNEIEAVLGASHRSTALRHGIEMQMIQEVTEAQLQDVLDVREARAAAHEAELAHFAAVTEASAVYVTAIQQVIAATSQMVELAIDGHQRNAQSARAMIDDRRAQEADLQAQILAGMSEQERAYAELQIARLQVTAEAAEDEYRTQARAGMRAFRANQILQTGLIAINSAAALIATFAQVGAPPAPGGYAAIAGVAAAQTAATVGVWAVQPPQFDAGFPGFSMGPTNYRATLDEGEGVANRRGMSALGGPEGMDELNRTGRLPTQGAQSARLYVDSRQLGEWVADEMGRGRTMTKAMRRKGYRPGVRMENR